MQRLVLGRVVAMLLVFAVVQPVVAQSQTENMARTYTLAVDPGMAEQVEEAIRGHMAWRQQHGDTWTWNVFQVVNGDNFGHYLMRSGGHRWADIDAYTPTTVGRDGPAHLLTTTGPYVTSVSNRITQVLSSVSRMPEDLSGMTLYAVTNYEVSSPVRFNLSIARFHTAISQANSPLRYQYAVVVNSGQAGTILVRPAENWSALAPPPKLIPQMLIEAYGEDDAVTLLEQFASSVRSMTSSIVQIRPDLTRVGQ